VCLKCYTKTSINPARSEGNVIFLWRRAVTLSRPRFNWTSRTGRPRSWARGRCCSATPTLNSSFTCRRPPNELEAFQYHPKCRPLLACGLVIPLIQLESPLHKEGLALLAILGNHLGLLTPGVNVNEGDLFPRFTRLRRVPTIDRQRQLRHGLPLGSITQLGVPSEVSHEIDLVEVGHGLSGTRVGLCRASGRNRSNDRRGSLGEQGPENLLRMADPGLDLHDRRGLRLEDHVDIVA